MSGKSSPIPAFYGVYVLRSTIRHASLYIGSTPNPPRRLKQHNGEAKGGAHRTSRDRLRPWEMIAMVHGFPSAVAALKFEWALANPHLTLHIPASSRVTTASGTKRNGMPKRPPLSLRAIISNIHLLTGVPSFARWPLSVRFFAKEAHKSWETWLKSAELPDRPGLTILTDFVDDDPTCGDLTRGIHALPLDYQPIKPYVEKAQNIVTFERQGDCAHCKKTLEPGQGLYAVCPNEGCEAMGHLMCWSHNALPGDGAATEELIPKSCTCPSCGGPVQWGDMMKELTLRTRGQDAVAKLIKKKRGEAKASAA